MIKLKNILNEQKPAIAAKANPTTTRTRETVNLYLDYENKKPFKFVVFVGPNSIEQLPMAAKEVLINVHEPKTQDDYKLTWNPKKPKEMILLGKQGAAEAELVYNKKLTKKLYNWYKSTINNPGATYAQTNQPEQPNELT